MYKTILVPLDGSKRAERILSHIENFAHSFGSKLTFLQVVRLSSIVGIEGPDMVLYGKKIEPRIKEAKSYLRAMKKEFREKDINIQTHVVQGPVVKSIIDLADREKVDLIAMTSHGRTGLARAYYGSVAAGVLHLADRPLLIVRSRAEQPE